MAHVEDKRFGRWSTHATREAVAHMCARFDRTITNTTMWDIVAALAAWEPRPFKARTALGCGLVKAS